MTRALAVVVALGACGDAGDLPIDAPDVMGLEAGLGTLKAEPAMLDGTTGADARHPIQITNTGVAPTAPLSTTLTGPDADRFALHENTCQGYALPEGATCQVAISMPCATPGSGGFRDAVLEVAGMPGGSVSVPIRLSIFGKSCIPWLIVSPGAYNFGEHVVGVATSSFRFTISNHGGKASAPLLHTLAGNDPEEFRLVGSTCTGASVPPGGSCTFDIVYDAITPGAKQAQIITSAPPESETAVVSGTAVPAASGPP